MAVVTCMEANKLDFCLFVYLLLFLILLVECINYYLKVDLNGRFFSGGGCTQIWFEQGVCS